jgi:hypothetical protein
MISLQSMDALFRPAWANPNWMIVENPALDLVRKSIGEASAHRETEHPSSVSAKRESQR